MGTLILSDRVVERETENPRMMIVVTTIVDGKKQTQRIEAPLGNAYIAVQHVTGDYLHLEASDLGYYRLNRGHYAYRWMDRENAHGNVRDENKDDETRRLGYRHEFERMFKEFQTRGVGHPATIIDNEDLFELFAAWAMFHGVYDNADFHVTDARDFWETLADDWMIRNEHDMTQ